MELWAALPFMSLADMCRAARAFEAIGLSGVAVSEHACVPLDQASVYPFTGTQIDVPPDTQFPAPLITAAVIGTVTERLRVMTFVLLAPLRHPIVLAKEAATASNASGGRLDLGLGTGWMREEYDALGVPFQRRGRRMDEILDLLPRLWSEPAVVHAGSEFSFEAVAVQPHPRERVPILVGGHSAAALRRAARHDGWVGGVVDVDTLADGVTAFRREVSEQHLDPANFIIRTALKGRVDPPTLERVAALGVDAVVVSPWQVARADTIFDISLDAYVEGLSAMCSSDVFADAGPASVHTRERGV